MSKKILCSIAPLLVLAVLAIAPSIASAAGEYGACAPGTREKGEPCALGEKFTAFPANTLENVVSKGVAGSGKFIIEFTRYKTGVECETVSGKGSYENVLKEGVLDGTATGELTLVNCKPIEELDAGCTEINPKTSHDIVGEVTSEVLSESKVEFFTKSGSQFDIKCMIAGSEVDVGGMSGQVKGKVERNKIVFEHAKGPESSLGNTTFTGSFESETEVGKNPVTAY